MYNYEICAKRSNLPEIKNKQISGCYQIEIAHPDLNEYNSNILCNLFPC